MLLLILQMTLTMAKQALLALRSEKLRLLAHLSSEVELVAVITVQFSRSVVSDSLTPSTPGLPVHHQLLESTQTYVH